ncbi:MAG: hypothetical protein UH734_00945 [Ruminococcus sp.]|nr:hypothetical protein [Ruminococcus sp.]
MKKRQHLILIIMLSVCLTSAVGCTNRSIEKENTAAATTKENQSTSNMIDEHSENKEKHTWKSQDNLIEFVCDGEYGVEGWGIYSGYYNDHNRKYKLNVEISEYNNHRIDFYYDANGQGVYFNVSDGESVEKGIAFLFGDVKYIDEKTFSVTVDGSGGKLKTKDDLPFDIPYQYEDVIIFKMIN